MRLEGHKSTKVILLITVEQLIETCRSVCLYTVDKRSPCHTQTFSPHSSSSPTIPPPQKKNQPNPPTEQDNPFLPQANQSQVNNHY